MKESLPQNFNPQEVLSCESTICRNANSQFPDDQRICLYAIHTDFATENFQSLGLTPDDFIESQNHIRDKCIYGDQIYTSRKNSIT